jgi:anti-sigma-K factor RskA
LEELASALALEAMEPEERQEYLSHLEGCNLCQGLVGEYQSAAELLPEALDDVVASPNLRSRIFTEAARDLATPAAQPRTTAAGGGWTWSWLRWPHWTDRRPMRLSAALAVVVAGLVAWNISLQVGGDGTSEISQQQQAVIDAIREGGTVLELSGTAALPQGNARVVVVNEGDVLHLLLRNVAPLSQDEVFEVWRIRNEVPDSLGTFALSVGSEHLVTLETDISGETGISGADTVAISIEVKGGSPTGQPQGPIVLVGPV